MQIGILFVGICLHAQNMKFPYNKKSNFITDITNDTIKLGETISIYGQDVQDPDIYYEKKKDGSLAVTRLSVIAPYSIDRWKPYLSVPSSTSIIISWKDLRDGIPYVKYGNSQNLLKFKAIGCTEHLKDETASYPFHKVKLNNLKPDTRYYYQVSGDDNIYHFKTQPKPGSFQKYRILFIGDHQMIDRSGYEWLIASAKRTFERKYGPVNENLNLLMNLGDQVDIAYLNLYEQCHFYKSSYIASYIPVMTTMGNHDIHKDYDLKKYSQIFSYEDLEYQGISSRVDDYYAIQLGAVLVISLNTEYPHTNNQQLTWLQKIIEKANKDENIKFIISTNHRNAYGETYNKDICTWLSEAAYPILGSSRKHVLNVNGHQHYYHRGQVIDADFYHVVTGGAAWGQRWRDSPDVADSEYIQKTFDYWSYMIAEFDPITDIMTAEAFSIGNSDVAHKELCIDYFYRNLRDYTKPERPVVLINSRKKKNPIIQLSPYKCIGKENFNTCQIQIATDSEFKNKVYGQIFHFENFFGDNGAPYFIPTDINKKQSYRVFTFPDSLQKKQCYYIRARYRNRNLQWSDWSDVLSVKF